MVATIEPRAVTARALLRWTVALWLPAAVAVSVAAGTGYGVGQNLLRSAANDPQLQIAEDASTQLDAGASPSAVASGPPVDLASSLAVEITVLDGDGNVLASTGNLDGDAVRPPSGSLEAATADEPNVLTWQPRHDVRLAAVIAAYGGPGSASGTVVVARSLRVVEEREARLLVLVAAGWVGGLALTAIASLAGAWPLSTRSLSATL